MPRSSAAASISAICGVVERGDDDQDRVGADARGLGDLPGIDHEVLAQDGQRHGVAGGDQIVVGALEIGLVGQDRQAGRAARLIGAGVRGGSKSARIRPLDGDAFLISAISAVARLGVERGAEAARRRRPVRGAARSA